MPKATGLVGAIHSVTDTAVTLIGGHGGIYEVQVGDEVLYTNQGSNPAALPSDADLVALIAPLAGFDAKPADGPVQMIEATEAASCPILNSVAATERVEDGSCGCG